MNNNRNIKDLLKTITFIVLCLAIVIFVIITSTSTNKAKQEPQDTSTDIYNTFSPSPTTPDETSTSTPTTSPSHTGTQLEEKPSWLGTMMLDPTDAQNAAQSTINSIVEYYKITPEESKEARDARLQNILLPDNTLAEDTPWGEYDSLVDESGITIEGSAVINTQEPLGGNGNEYRSILSLNAQMIINYPAESQERSQLFQEYITLEVRMVKLDGSWKLAEVIEK